MQGHTLSTIQEQGVTLSQPMMEGSAPTILKLTSYFGNGQTWHRNTVILK